MYLKWEDRFSVGIKTFDDQHQQLFDIINRLFASLKTRKLFRALGKEEKERELLGTILTELLGYTKLHFETEEWAMRECGFAGYEGHKKEHDEFAALVNDFVQRSNKGESVLTAEVLNSLVKWLDRHLNGTDKMYSSYLIEKGVK